MKKYFKSQLSNHVLGLKIEVTWTKWQDVESSW